ncbi:MAG: glycosyltransferase family 2 protein [Lachnospiraceae bacterium]|nr:glycosyltransferase family 2 protein [Lachnospiraceae bacterium]
MDKLYIIIPAYNEEATIESIVDEWYPVVDKAGDGSRLVIIDDGSRDATLEKLNKKAESAPKLIVKHKENSGHGPTILFGYKYAIEEGADYVFQTDSDGQTDPDEFKAFWKNRADFDMLIGDRTGRQDGFSRIVVTRVLRLVILLTFHVWVKDANTPFRLMNCKTLKEKLKYIPDDYFLTNVLISVIYAKHDNSVRYIPITFKPRQGGVNSINIKKIFNVGLKSLVEFVKLNRIISRS